MQFSHKMWKTQALSENVAGNFQEAVGIVTQKQEMEK